MKQLYNLHDYFSEQLQFIGLYRNRSWSILFSTCLLYFLASHVFSINWKGQDNVLLSGNLTNIAES